MYGLEQIIEMNEAATDEEPRHQGLPVQGYRPQTEEAVFVVNQNKEIEEWVLRVLDLYTARDDVDQRWLAIGRSHIEQGFMAINRAIFRPGRVDLGE